MRQLRSFSLFRQRMVSLIAVLLIVAGIMQAQNAAKPVRLIAGPIENNQIITLKGNVHPLATAANDRGAAPDSLPLERMVLLLNRSAQQRQALLKLADDQQNSKSHAYHKWLTPAQFGAQFGIGDADLATLSTWLESYGFKIETISPARNFITFSGTHAQLKSAFHTEIHQYRVNGSSYWANAGDPQIPAVLSPVIQGIASLNNFPRHAQHTQPKLVRRNASSGKWEVASSAQGGALAAKAKPLFTTPDGNGGEIFAIGPADLATIYNVQPLYTAGINGAGQTIALVADSDINPADVDYFRSIFGLPAKNLNLIYNGPDPGLNGDEEEADVDVQWSGAVAPQATIDLVVSGNTNVAAGVDLSALYIVENNLAPIMSESFGNCELFLGTNGNQFFDELWRQAAAQGITVMVSAGDAGSAGCDQNQFQSDFGLAVNGIASTPYNVAVGGTDLYGTFLSPNLYWNATNTADTLESALAYIPELPWNNSCASPQVFAALQAGGVTDPTPAAVCNDQNLQQLFLNTAGGSGGASGCIVSAPFNIENGPNPASCLVGYEKPAWQSGIPGIPGDGARDMPDISLMAGSGLWGSFYVFCESDATPNGVCDVNNALEGAGGTSFGSPIFAGLISMVEQKTQSQQGNVNYVLYKLGAAQYANAALGQSCSSENVTGGNQCMFYDVDQGTNTVPCAFMISPNCNVDVPTYGEGLLTGYNAGTGFDLATGIGTVNAFNMVQGWNSVTSAFLPSSTTLTASGSTTLTYGATLNVNVAVSAVSPATGTPSGDFSILSNSSIPGDQSVAGSTLGKGQAMVPVQGLPVGSYNLTVHYPGDATFAASNSNAIAITVNQAASTISLTASRTTVLPGQSVSFFVSIAGSASGADPTGTLTFTDRTTGQSLGTAAVTAVAENSQPLVSGFVTLPYSVFSVGAHTVTASYSGDGNYLPANAGTVSILVAGPFSVGLNPTSLNIAAASTGGNTLTVTASPNGNAILNAGTLSFACQGTLPLGLACAFSAPAAQADGSLTSTMTLQLSAPLLRKKLTARDKSNSDRVPNRPVQYGIPGLSGILMLLLVRRRRRLSALLGVLMLLAASGLTLAGCGGSGNSPVPTPAAPTVTTTTLQASSASPALNSAVTFSATVASGSGTPTGSVAFMSGSTTLATVQLVNGGASYSTSSLPIGSQSIVAQYAGDSAYSSSTSLSTTVDVTYSTTLTVTGQDNAGNTGSVNLPLTID
jgi:hypothetical protein